MNAAKKYILSGCLMLAVCALSAQKLTPLDSSSKVHFVIKNFGINTGGDLTGLEGIINFEPANPGESSFIVSAKTNTVDTDNEMRDEHLRKEEYFDVSNFPVIKIISDKITVARKKDQFNFSGQLIIKGTSKKIEFPFEATPVNGGYLFTGKFNINRREFGIGGNSVSISDMVKVELSVFAR